VDSKIESKNKEGGSKINGWGNGGRNLKDILKGKVNLTGKHEMFIFLIDKARKKEDK